MSFKAEAANPDLKYLAYSISLLKEILSKPRTFKWVKRAMHRKVLSYIDTDEGFYWFWAEEGSGRFRSMKLFRLIWKLGYGNDGNLLVKNHDCEYSKEELKLLSKYKLPKVRE